MEKLNNEQMKAVTGGWHPYVTRHGDNLPNGMTREMALLFFFGTLADDSTEKPTDKPTEG
jgi:hypothetical protein